MTKTNLGYRRQRNQNAYKQEKFSSLLGRSSYELEEERKIDHDEYCLSDSSRHDDIAQTLVIDQPSMRRKRARRSIGIAVLAVLVIGVGLWMASKGHNMHAPKFKVADVQRGSLTVTVTATGKVKPINQVDVGSEVSGTIETVDVDYNDRVKQGQVLATLDTDQRKAEVLQSKALLESAKARLREAKASVVETRLRFKRMQNLATKGLAPQQEFDESQAAYLRAQAIEAIAEAEISVARAKLKANQTDLDKATIRSPIDGIVLARKVEPGQTVAATFETPVLFTLAEDLTRMVLHVDIDEADIGPIKVGQKAIFTVDAYQNRDFTAKITSIRNEPQTVEKIVTYKALLSVDNTELLLRPGMTVTANIVTHIVADAILVPNGALRFTPVGTERTTAANAAMSRGREQQLWTLSRDDHPVPIPVNIGLSDGRNTEILDGDLEPGLPLLVGEVTE